MHEKAYLIHLKRASARRQQVDRIVEACPMPIDIVHAVDGHSLSLEEVSQAYVRNRHEPPYPFELKHGEVGCFLSHRKCWRRMVDENLDAALILEDDIEIDKRVFERALGIARNHVNEVGYIQFQVRTVPTNATVIAVEGETQLVRTEPVQLRTSAQFVSRSAAHKLLELTHVFDRPVDTYLQMHWLTGIHLASATPSGISDQSLNSGGSTISSKKSFFENATRTWKRWHYRRNIRHYHVGRQDDCAMKNPHSKL